MVAFIAGLVVFVISPIASAVLGTIFGHSAVPTSNFSEGFAQGQQIAQTNPQILAASGFIVLQIVLGTGIGIWALVQGIVAVRLNRGRVFGILAVHNRRRCRVSGHALG
jgi:hypothetical protein